ncbi:hypothetical protein Pmani_006144 [Petrolisthes manimaculis]|uniref:Major facilitator superfamily (MFS) profile domain-containing protein n=1 Tax=Petrolisthes manimaculis TaxID=1843537 RepID=A0AAE1QAW6_9EUCA|nr:hypothetical protein Pmani_006144 [Petrolisthes manimaculis]
MKINRDLLPIKAHYFLRYAGTAHLIYLLPLIVREKGVSPQVVGLLWTILPGLSLITSTIAGPLADRLKAHRAVFLFSLVALIVGCCSIVLIPKMPGAEGGYDIVTTDQHNSSLIHSNNASLLITATGNYTHTYTHTTPPPPPPPPPHDVMVDPDMVIGEGQPPILITGQEPTSSTQQESDNPLSEFIKYPQFWLVFFALMVEQMGITICVMISDAVCFLILGTERHKYGEQRLWGTVGMGVMGVISGAAIDFASLGQKEKNYLPALAILLVLMTIDLVLVSLMKIPNKLESKMKFGDVGSTLLHPQVILFLVSVFVMGTTLGVIWVFRMLMMEDVAMSWDPQFSAMKLLLGLTLFIENFGGELPFFFLSGKILRRFDHTTVLGSALVASSLRCCLYYTVSNPWLFLPIELLNGISYGLFHTAMTTYASRIAPPGSQATLQSIVRAGFSAGLSTAGFVGGWLYKMLGGSQTFLAIGVFVACYSLIFIVCHFLINKFCTNNNNNNVKGYEEPSCTNSSSATEPDRQPTEPVKEPLVKAV